MRDARRRLHLATELNPAESRLWRDYVELLHRSGRHADIEPFLERCLEEPDRSGRKTRTIAKLAQRFAPASFDRLMSARAERAESDPRMLFALADIHRRAGDLGLALDRLDRASALTSRSRRTVRGVRKKIGKQLSKMGLEAAALDHARRSDIRLPATPLKTLIEQTAARSETYPGHGVTMVVTTLGPGGAERQLDEYCERPHAAGPRAGHQDPAGAGSQPERRRFYQTQWRVRPFRSRMSEAEASTWIA